MRHQPVAAMAWETRRDALIHARSATASAPLFTSGAVRGSASAASSADSISSARTRTARRGCCSGTNAALSVTTNPSKRERLTICSLTVRSDAGCCTVAARVLWMCAGLNLRLQIDEFGENAGGLWLKRRQPGIWGPLVARGRRRLAAVARRRKSVRLGLCVANLGAGRTRIDGLKTAFARYSQCQTFRFVS